MASLPILIRSSLRVSDDVMIMSPRSQSNYAELVGNSLKKALAMDAGLRVASVMTAT